MIDRRITYCIPTKNNLRYLKNSINSIRENSSNEYDIVVFVDADNDGTIDWLDENKIRYAINETNEPKGIAYGYNRCIEMAETPIVCMFHADMYMGKGFDIGILKYLKPLSVVSGTRIEPPLHPNGLEKIVKDFGMYPEDFKKESFDSYVVDMIEHSNGKTTKGIFAPWAIYKEDITSIGMHDESFHSYHEDSDIFNRFILNEYDIIQSWEAYVYHLTCRGGQFQDGIEKVTTDPLFHKMKQNAFRNYIRKWGHFVKNDEYQYPILPHKYNIGITMLNPTYEIFNFLEPWTSNINVNLPNHQLDMYVQLEQPNTTVNLSEKINNTLIQNDIEVEIDANKMTNESVNFIVDLSSILDANDLQIGEYQFDIFKIKVNRINHLEHKLIKCNN
jgi:glycosyltransferase involved in cell wall biosynthesis